MGSFSGLDDGSLVGSAGDMFSLVGGESYHDMDDMSHDVSLFSSGFREREGGTLTAGRPREFRVEEGNALKVMNGAAFAETVLAKSREAVSSSVRAPPRAQYPEFRTSVFYDPRTNPGVEKPELNIYPGADGKFWKDVRHWNRENCGWTMGREGRFRVKVDRDLAKEDPGARFALREREEEAREEEEERRREDKSKRVVYRVQSSKGAKEVRQSYLRQLYFAVILCSYTL